MGDGASKTAQLGMGISIQYGNKLVAEARRELSTQFKGWDTANIKEVAERVKVSSSAFHRLDTLGDEKLCTDCQRESFRVPTILAVHYLVLRAAIHHSLSSSKVNRKNPERT